MSLKLESTAEVLRDNLGREELIEWWKLVINSDKRVRRHNLSFTIKEVAFVLRALKSKFRIIRSQKFVGKTTLIFYSVNEAEK